MPQWLTDFLNNNAQQIDILLKILGFLVVPIGALFAAIGWLVHRWWRGRLRVEVSVFEVIADPTTLLLKLYGEENTTDPLAHHRIRYQPRDSARDIQVELRSALIAARYLLIIAPTGYGKTREAATLAQSLMNEGWRVVRVRTGWLDKPKTLPAELKDDRRRILILLDDLNGLFRMGGFMQSPKSEEMPTLGQPSYHDRLCNALDAFEEMCGTNEIRVIATARNETEDWQVLNFGSRDRLWKRFTQVELPAPCDEAIVTLLDETSAHANLHTERADFTAMARKNDGTYANVVLNLRRAQKEDKVLSLANYTATLAGSWQEVYQSALSQHPAISYVYDAIDMLRQIRIDLYPWLVEPAALSLSDSNRLKRMMLRYQIKRALHYLVHERKIITEQEGKLVVHDGQIEAKGTHRDWKLHALILYRFALHLLERQPRAVAKYLWNPSDHLHELGSLNEYKQLQPRYLAWNLSDHLYELGALNEYKQLQLRCLAAAKELEDREMQAAIYNDLSYLAISKGEWDEAEKLANSSLQLYTLIKHILGQVIARRYLATIAVGQGDYKMARTQLEQLLKSINNELKIANEPLQFALKRQAGPTHDMLVV